MDAARSPKTSQRLLSRGRRRLAKLGRYWGTVFRIPINYRFPQFFLLLTADHLLPTYQRNFPLYDRFLPYLSAHLLPGDTVIDVGANCGDTLAAMVSVNQTLQFICIEPDQTFYSILERNCERIRKAIPGVSISIHRRFIGSSIKKATLTGALGTKKMVVMPSEDAEPTVELDRLVDLKECRNIRLLKSDVDGFDFDVLNSAKTILSRVHPMLFFEIQLDHEFQMSAYLDLIGRLFSQGYIRWTIFDNFGEVLMRDPGHREIAQLIGYIWRQNSGRATRTIYYLDALAANESDAECASQAVDAFLARALQ